MLMPQPWSWIARGSQEWLPRIAVVAVTAWALTALPHGWYPHDEGQLGQTAERILNGELPHRDFVDPYTGGLGYWNALGFWLAGTHSLVMRFQLVPWFLLFAGCCYGMARRVATAWEAAAVASLCVVLTLPVYAAGMPSWYNLFCAVLGAAALLKSESESESGGARRWLFVAGFCGGLSILFKIVGLFYLGGGLLYLFFRDAPANPDRSVSPATKPRSTWLTVALVAGLLSVGGLGSLFVLPTDVLGTLLQLVLPFLGVVFVAIVREFRRGVEDSRGRLWHLVRTTTPFLAGAALAPVLWGGWYAWEGALGNLIEGVFILPRKRITDAAMAFPTDERWVSMILFAAPIGIEMWLNLRRIALRSVFGVAFVLLCVGQAVWSGQVVGFVEPELIVHFVPPFTLAALGLLLRVSWSTDRLTAPARGLFLFLALATFHGLIQFPHAAFVYFCYAAPLYVLAGLYLVKSWDSPPRATLVALVVSLLLVFTVQYRHYSSTLPPWLASWPASRPVKSGPANSGPAGWVAAAPLELARSNLRVYASDAGLYNSLIPFVQGLTRPGERVLAFPDCPEVTFLSGRPNPSPLMYEFLAPDPERQERWLKGLLREDEIRVVVFNHTIDFDPATQRRWLEELNARFPHQRCFTARDTVVRDRIFTVFWRP